MSDRIKDLPKNMIGQTLGKLHDPKASFKLPEMPKSAREILDSFGSKALNHLMKNLKGMLSLRAEKGMELAAKRQMGEAMRGKAPQTETPQTEAPQTEIRPAVPPGVERTAAEPAKGLTLFEKVLLARFEKGQALGERLEGGQQQFLAKTPEGWRAFFQKFLPFTIQKKGKMAELEAVVYRGLVEEESIQRGGREGTTSAAARRAAAAGAIAMLISDLRFQSRTDRFARLEVPNSILMKLASLMPGETLGKALLASFLGGPEFAYTAISHKIVQPDLIRAIAAGREKGLENAAVESAARRAAEQGHVVGREPMRGIALTARAEQMAAEQLELHWRPAAGNVKEPSARHGGVGAGALVGLKTRRKKGLFGSMWGDETADAGGVFVPWYQQLLRFKKHPGRPRWFVPLIYFVFFSAVALSAVYVFKFLLQK